VSYLTEENVGKLPPWMTRRWGDDDNKETPSFLPIFVDDPNVKFHHKDRPEIEYSTWVQDEDKSNQKACASFFSSSLR
jgi:hypothetical protein